MTTLQPCDYVVMHQFWGPNHLARLRQLTRVARERHLEVCGLEISTRQVDYPWIVADQPEIVRKVTMFPGKAVEEVRDLDLVRQTWVHLNALNPRALAIQGYTTAGMLTALVWALCHKRGTVLMMDSHYASRPRSGGKEGIKKAIMSRFDAVFTSGLQSRRYAEYLGMAPERIFRGVDVVDNDYYAAQAESIRRDADRFREAYSLPEKYFLCVSRLIPGKNIDGLLTAYSQYYHQAGREAWGLVICGSGSLEDGLKRQAQDLGLDRVMFTGFVQIDTLPVFYSLARCLVFPTLKDTWGLVVNEALAVGLPVLASTGVGCAPDLIQPGKNGYLFDPRHPDELSRLLLKMSSPETDLTAMGQVSRQIVADWSLDTYAQNLLAALDVAGVRKTGNLSCTLRLPKKCV